MQQQKVELDKFQVLVELHDLATQPSTAAVSVTEAEQQGLLQSPSECFANTHTSGAMNSFWPWCSGPKGQQKADRDWSCTWAVEAFTLQLQKASVPLGFCPASAFSPTTTNLNHMFDVVQLLGVQPSW